MSRFMRNQDSIPEVLYVGCTDIALRVHLAVTRLTVCRHLHTPVQGQSAQTPVGNILGFATFDELVLRRLRWNRMRLCTHASIDMNKFPNAAVCHSIDMTRRTPRGFLSLGPLFYDLGTKLLILLLRLLWMTSGAPKLLHKFPGGNLMCGLPPFAHTNTGSVGPETSWDSSWVLPPLNG